MIRCIKITEGDMLGSETNYSIDPPPPPSETNYSIDPLHLQSAKVTVDVSEGQPLFTFGLPMFAWTLGYFLSLLWGPSTNTNFHVKNIIWMTQTKSVYFM